MPNKKVLFVTKRLPSRPSDEAIQSELRDRFPDAVTAPPQPFPQPDHCPIEVPLEFQGDSLLSDTFRLAVHEVSHSLIGLLFCGWVDAVVLTSSVESGGIGRSYGTGGSGENGARCSLAGLAGERLVEGYPLPLVGFKTDLENARADLRFAKVPEDQLDSRAQAIYREIQRTLADMWVHALTTAATQLTKRGILDGQTLLSIFSDAQDDSAKAGMFAKAFANVQIGNGTGQCHIDSVPSRLSESDKLARELKFGFQADMLKKSLTDHSLSALEVVKRSVVIDHLQRRAGIK